MNVPFHKVALTDEEIGEVVDCLRSGWLTTGARVRQLEQACARYTGAAHAVAVSSCTAALHLALEAVGVQPGDLVLVPTMTFVATAEAAHYCGATPVLVDCDPVTLCLDPAAVERTLAALADGAPVPGLRPPYGRVRALLPMHYGGQMADVDTLRGLASRHDLALVEDAAHTLPAAIRSGPGQPWRSVGTTGDITCLSFYATKCITTGEGGMAVTDNPAWAERMRLMSLHGLRNSSWNRSAAPGSWRYDIIDLGFKYNLTDIAAAIGLRQLERVDQLWQQRRRVARCYHEGLGDLEQLELPVELADRRHSWHLFAVRLRLEQLAIDRQQLLDELSAHGIVCSVHWLPLHLSSYFQRTFGYRPEQLPVASDAWPRLISLPIYPSMADEEIDHVVSTLRALLRRHRR